MSTVVLTLVFVGGSIAAVAVVLLRDDVQPATEAQKSERVWLDNRLSDLWAWLRRVGAAGAAAVTGWSNRRGDRIAAKVDRRSARAERRQTARSARVDHRAERRDAKREEKAAATAAARSVTAAARPTGSLDGVDPRIRQLVDDGAVAVTDWVEPGDPVAPRPGFWRRVRASFGLAVVIIAIGIALTALIAVAGVLIARTLENAVN